MKIYFEEINQKFIFISFPISKGVLYENIMESRKNLF